MARLNEPVAPMENIESLKRKFMRQNRDIARVNSTQSIRIRNLENEVSNLLTENLALREQLSRYKLELEGGKAQRIADHTGEVKAQLEEKLLELSELIGELGHPPRSKKPSPPKRGKIILTNPNQSPKSRAWRNEATEQEGRLPPIMEHKTYPRKTLECQEISNLVAGADATDSPEIGPPPVSKFVDEDPVKIDLPKRTRPQASEEVSGLDPSLSINLEQRRKRKDSGGASESRRSSEPEFVVEDVKMGGLNTGERSVRPEEVVEERNSVTNPKSGTRQSRHELVAEESSSRATSRNGGRSVRSDYIAEEPSSVTIIKTGGRLNRQDTMVEDTNSIAKSSGRPVRLEPIVQNPGTTVTIKVGGKRKLSVREDDEHQVVATSVESPDDFKFTRVAQDERTKNHSASQSERPMAKTTRELAVARGVSRAKPSDPMLPSTRKVLAPKSVNNSPKKATKTAISEESKPLKPDAPKFNPTKDRKERRQEPVQIKAPELLPPPLDTIIVQPEPDLEPETPAGLDLFSPQSSNPSTARVESRDTPPPSELGSGTEGQRPSRRARGAVSYAEPNLRDKMRRPTKDMTDAVGRDEKSHRGSSVRLEEGIMSTDVKIKQEPEDDLNEMPAASFATVEGSPLRSKTSVSDSLPSSITTHRKRRESLLHQIEADNHTSGSGSAIAALLAETRKAKAAVREKGKERAHEGDGITNAMSKMEIYEFKDPSPHTEYVVRDTKENNKLPARVSRRHSTMPHEPTPEDSEASDMEATRKSEIHSSRRRQSALTMKTSSARNEPASRETVGEKNLKRSSSTAGVGGSETMESRSERISARRRSMML